MSSPRTNIILEEDEPPEIDCQVDSSTSIDYLLVCILQGQPVDALDG